MLKCIRNTECYKSLNLSLGQSHAYLFYSLDSILNKEIALGKAKEILCENGNCCDACASCAQFNSLSHPDLTVMEQDAIKVEDISKLQMKLSTKPVFAKYRVFVILNADTINEIAQNKLLKSLEEPSDSAIFLLTTSQLSKLLPTVLSRLNKIFVPSLSKEDLKLIGAELRAKGIDIFGKIDATNTLTECISYATNEVFNSTLEQVFSLLENLNTTADIPTLTANLGIPNKNLFLKILMDIFLDMLSNKKFDKSKIENLKTKFNDKAIIKILPKIDEAYRYINANVNFSYVLDNLLFDILKEKFLCK